MMKHIHRLRQKPDHHKKRFAFMVSSAVTFLIFIFWLASFNATPQSIAEDAQNKGIFSPFKTVGEGVANMYSAVVSSKEAFNRTHTVDTSIEVVSGDN